MDSKTEHDDHSKDNTMSSKTKARALDLLSYGRDQADRVVNPATRQRLFDSAWSFASERPLLSVCCLIPPILMPYPLSKWRIV